MMKNKDFLRGVGSVLQLYPDLRKIDKSFSIFIKDDVEALRDDWYTVGTDIKQSAEKVVQK